MADIISASGSFGSLPGWTSSPDCKGLCTAAQPQETEVISPPGAVEGGLHRL